HAPSRSMADGATISQQNGPGEKEPGADKSLPFSIDAEQAVLGAILFDNEIFFRVSAYLKGEHFYDPVHQVIFEACGDLINKGRLASPTIIDAFLSKSEGFSELGGRGYLETLAANVPGTAGAHDYARVVFDLSVYRGLIAIGGEIEARARDVSVGEDPSDQLEAAEKSLYALAETGKYGSGFKNFRTAAMEAIEVADAAIKRGGGLAGVATGLVDLDRMLGGLHPSDLVILAGRPSMGKTALATNIAVNAALAHQTERAADGVVKTVDGAAVGLFSLEMAAKQIAMRIIAERSGVSSNDIMRGMVDQDQFDKVYHAARELENMPLYIDDTGGLTIAQLAARARRLKRQHGLDLLVVDYLQLLSGSSSRGDNRVQEITEISIGLKALAKELNVPVVALSQLSRQVEARDDKRPQLSDLRESGSIEQDADVVLFVFREEYYLKRQEPREGTADHDAWREKCDDVAGVAEVIIGKQRHGPIGKVALAFQENLTKFSNLARDDYRDPYN
ncbi:MAG: replicative DNA helicase, partial [Pseudomonadota bacterium]